MEVTGTIRLTEFGALVTLNKELSNHHAVSLDLLDSLLWQGLPFV